MGRSVYAPPEAEWTLYFHPEIDDIGADYLDFDDMVDDLVSLLRLRWPSVVLPDVHRWHGREGKVIAENALGCFVLAEYCGLCSLSFVAFEDSDYHGLACQWAEQVRPFVVQLLPNPLVRLGGMSDGTSVYRRM